MNEINEARTFPISMPVRRWTTRELWWTVFWWAFASFILGLWVGLIVGVLGS